MRNLLGVVEGLEEGIGVPRAGAGHSPQGRLCRLRRAAPALVPVDPPPLLQPAEVVLVRGEDEHARDESDPDEQV
jgi:hypothetical protein